MGTVRCRIAGVTFNNEDGSNRQEILSRMAKKRRVRFRDARTDEYPNAISVHNVKGEQLGFLPEDVSSYIRERQIDPTEILGEVHSVGENKDGSALGCVIDINNDRIVDYAVGYQPFGFVGNQDWNAIREQTGKAKITHEDVTAYNNSRGKQVAASSSSSRSSSSRSSKPKDQIGCVGTLACIAFVAFVIYFLINM